MMVTKYTCIACRKRRRSVYSQSSHTTQHSWSYAI